MSARPRLSLAAVNGEARPGFKRRARATKPSPHAYLDQMARDLGLLSSVLTRMQALAERIVLHGADPITAQALANSMSVEAGHAGCISRRALDHFNTARQGGGAA
jgi:hypothetical protein